MKVVRFDRLLASTALGLVLVLSGQAVKAQQPQDQQIQIVVLLPDDMPPPTLKDFNGGAETPAPASKMAEPTKDESTKAPLVKAAAAPAVNSPQAAADSTVSDKLREIITGKALDRAIGRKAERAGVEALFQSAYRRG